MFFLDSLYASQTYRVHIFLFKNQIHTLLTQQVYSEFIIFGNLDISFLNSKLNTEAFHRIKCTSIKNSAAGFFIDVLEP